MEFDGILKISEKRDKKGKVSQIHTVEFTNQKGKAISFPVHERARCYNAAARDGEACHIVVEGSTIVKCVVPGKEAEPTVTVHKTAAHDMVKSQNRGNIGASAPSQHKPVYGKAPYNFVPYKDGALVSPKKDEQRKWSGQIICSLEALTPLLVSGKQGRSGAGAGDCAFMQVNGKRIIPGTAIKGMLRSLMEILSFSGMRPMNRKKLFWRKNAKGTDSSTNVAEAGTRNKGAASRYRLQYNYSPYDLAWPDEQKRDFQDMAEAIFGHVGKQAWRGRVAIEPFEIRGKEYGPGDTVVLAEPKPTYVPFYLQQPGKIKVLPDGRGNDRASMKNYNDRDARLRGRKLYWHHEVKLPPPGNGNKKTQSILHPLDKGASGEFVIHVDRLTDTELGCLFEALELGKGCAHKLGMGRSLGFGSVKIAIKAANICDAGVKYRSLAARLKNNAFGHLDVAGRENLRSIFRAHVFESIKKDYPDARDFYGLEPIAVLYLMLNFERKPAPAAVATMQLGEFRNNPLLPEPRQVLDAKA